jgi:DNA repair exonuclease SbcCD ATPase subunit
MNLNTLIKVYEKNNQFEIKAAAIAKNTQSDAREEIKLKEQLTKIKQDLALLDEQTENLEKELDRETLNLTQIKEKVDQSGITRQTLTELENRHHELVSRTEILEKKSNDLDALFGNIMTLLADPLHQSEFRQLITIDTRLMQQVRLQKKLSRRKKDLEKKKNNLAADLKKTTASIEKIKGKYQQDIESFVQYRKESPALEKKKTSLNKEAETLSGKIKKLAKKLQNEASEEIVAQQRKELEQRKKELDFETQRRTTAETKKQEITHQMEQDTQRLDKIKGQIAELEKINDHTTKFLHDNGIDPQYTPTTDRQKTIDTIRYLKKYFRDTVMVQDDRTGRNGHLTNENQ